MQFQQTINQSTGKSRYYINGKNVSRSYWEYKKTYCSMWGKLDSMLTKVKGNYIRHYSCGNVSQ